MSNNLEQKATEILSNTAKEQKKYSNERKLLFSLLENTKEDNSEKIQQMLEIFYRIIKLEADSESYNKLKVNFNTVIDQQIRKEDNNNTERITLFKIKDNNNEEYTFFSRESAKNYIENNSEDFENTEIEVVKNNNMDLESLISNFKI